MPRSPSASNDAPAPAAAEIDSLAANHSARARGLRNNPHRTKLSFAQDGRRNARYLPWFAREMHERFREQSVTGENRQAFAVDDVVGRSASPQRVVVHGRQIVVDERVGVNQLEGARGRHRCRACAFQMIGIGGFSRCKRQHRPKALAAGQQAVAHRVCQRRRARGRRWQCRVERPFDLDPPRVEPRVEIRRGAHR